MREEEAKQIGNWLAEIDSQSISPCVNLGSSTHQQKQSQTQSHTQIYIWRPLQQCGVKVLHADIKDAEGVDIVGDIFDERTQQRIREIKPKLIFCCNMLEHVEEPGRLAQICADCLSPGGKLIVSVPCSYPYHDDPIDTMFRPSPDEVAGLFSSLHVVRSKIVKDISMWQTMRQYQSWTWIAKFLAKSAVIALPFMIFRGVQRWKNKYHKFLWFFRPYRITCLLLEKPLTPTRARRGR